MKLKFNFKVEMSPTDSKSSITNITSITTEEGTKYAMPEEFKHINAHKKLQESDIYAKVKAKLKRRHDEVSVWVVLTKELQQTYMDEGGNIEFEGQLLDEIQEDEERKGTEKTDLAKIVEKLIESSQKQTEEKNLKHIADKFIIEKFNSKNSNARQWLEMYEKECLRFKIDTDRLKIEILRFFLSESCQNWYTSRIIKDNSENNWGTWRENFLESFANKGWSTRIHAHLYRYQEGSLLDYAMKKERLMLEINKSIDQDTLIDIIALGLPEFIRKKIDRDQIKNITDLFNEIRKCEDLMYKKNNTTTRNSKLDFKKKNLEKKPCKTCEYLNKGVRYHPEEKCWFKIKENEKEKNKTGVIGSNTVLEVDLNTEAKNE